jgi:hypothetical protein
MVALAREGARGRRSVARLETIGRAVPVPLYFGIAGVVVAGATASWSAGLVLATLAMLFTVTVSRLAVAQRWQERRRADAVAIEASSLREELVARLLPEHCVELASLEGLIEQLRREHASASDRSDDPTAESELVTNLDALLVAYVELGLELQSVASGLAATVNAAPRLAGIDPSADAPTRAESTRGRRIAHLRLRARHRGRNRIELLEHQLANIAELVRLVHEQTFASRTSASTLVSEVREVLDDAEQMWRAHEEVNATLRHDDGC